MREKVHDFRHDDTGGGRDRECQHSKGEDAEGLRRQENRPVHGDAHAGAEENGDDVDDLVLGGFAEAVDDPAFAHEIPKEEHEKEGRRGGNDQYSDHEDRGGEEEFFEARNLPQFGHPDAAFVGIGKGAHDRRLNHGDERHVAIGRHRNRTEEVRCQFVGEEDGGWAVGTTDDADRAAFLQAVFHADFLHGVSGKKDPEDSELRRRAQQHGARVRDERPEIGQRPHPHENDGRE